MRKLHKTLIICSIIIVTISFSVGAKSENADEITSDEITSDEITSDEITPVEITDINNLIEKAIELDGQEVTIQGEAIGERMDRGDYSWININDGTNAIGVWIDKIDAAKILNYGNYKNKGDTVKITGTFNRACTEHGGEADLHNKSIEIVNVGYDVKEPISSSKIISAVALSVIALFLLVTSIKSIKKKNE